MTAPAGSGTGIPVRPPLAPGRSLRGHYAGFVSRFIAFVLDCVVSITAFMLVVGAVSFASWVLTGSFVHWNRGDPWVVLAFVGWQFLFYSYFWGADGKTPGMALVGVQIVGEDGSRVGARRGLLRTLAFPLSFLLLGLGFLGILLGRDRRALHDSIAGTAVVYAWSAREARLRSLARQGGARGPKRKAPLR